MEKKSKLLNIKAYYIIIAPIIFIAIIAILSTIAIILKEGETYDVCAEMVVAFALWLMPLGDLVCALVGLKSFKKKRYAHPYVHISTIHDSQDVETTYMSTDH